MREHIDRTAVRRVLFLGAHLSLSATFPFLGLTSVLSVYSIRPCAVICMSGHGVLTRGKKASMKLEASSEMPEVIRDSSLFHDSSTDNKINGNKCDKGPAQDLAAE